MNLIEIKKLLQVQKLLDDVLGGKIEYRKNAEKAKEILDDVMEFKDITPLRFGGRDMLTEEHKRKIKYLNQYRYLDKKIDRKIKELENWKSRIFNVTGTLTDMPRSGNRSNVIENGIAAIDEIESSINQDIDKLLEIKEDIEEKIDSVDDIKLRELLESRYFDFKSWEEIAYRNGCSWRWVYTLHEKALEKINLD